MTLNPLNKLPRIRSLVPRLAFTDYWNAGVISFIIFLWGSGLVTYGFGHGWFSIRPWAILSVCSVLILFGGYKFSVFSNIPTGIMLALLTLRMIDVILRPPNLSFEMDAVKSCGSIIVLYVAMLSMIGRPTHRFLGWLVGGGLLLACVTMNIWEVRNPGYFSLVAGRSAGWSENPNQSAQVIVLAMAGMLSLHLSRLNGTIILLSGLLGVFLTYSRGGMFVWACVLLCYIILESNRRNKTAILFFALSLVVLVMGAVFGLGSISEDSDENVRGRTEQLTGAAGVDADDTSRVTMLLDSLGGVAESPIIGYGTFASIESYHPHNQWIGAWLDSGILGPVLMLLGFAALTREALRSNPHALIVIVAMVGFTLFSHNLLGDYLYMFYWIFTASVSTTKLSKPRTELIASKNYAKSVGKPCVI